MLQAEPTLYPIADALQADLTVCKGGDFVGKLKRNLHLGPWKVGHEAKIKSDQVTHDRSSAFVHIHSHLWGYIICDHLGKRLRLALFDASVAKVRYGEIDVLRTGNITNTLKALQPAIVAAFIYENSAWAEYAASDLVNG